MGWDNKDDDDDDDDDESFVSTTTRGEGRRRVRAVSSFLPSITIGQCRKIKGLKSLSFLHLHVRASSEPVQFSPWLIDG